jgi:hypothetical protein
MRYAATALGLALAVAALAPAAAQQPFDGQWIVDVVTERGACERAYRYPVMVQNGQIRSGGVQGVLGTVTPQGTVRSSVATSQARVEVAGRVTARSGGGTWAVTGARNCSGSWRAQRQG